MGVSHPRVLAVSLGVAGALGGTGGAAYAVFGDVSFAYGVATGLFVVGLIALAMGLLGATEPPQGWATRLRAASAERRSVAARLAGDVGAIERVTSLGLLVWALVVGGGLLVLSMLIFAAVT